MPILKNIILASKSPRRRELIRNLFPIHEVADIDCNEEFPKDIEIQKVASFLAHKKSQTYGSLRQDEILISADTTVLLGENILNKPLNLREGEEMLKELMGKTHEVVTGVCVRDNEKSVVFSESTMVEMEILEDYEISYYLNNFNFLDKAGSYGIQDWIGFIGVKRIIGDYYNVMGLPIHALYRAFRENWPTYSFFSVRPE